MLLSGHLADGASAAPRKKRQRIDRGLGAAEFIDQSAEGGGPDILASDQPEPGDVLMMVEPARALRLGRDLRRPSRQCAPPRLSPGARYWRRAGCRE